MKKEEKGSVPLLVLKKAKIKWEVPEVENWTHKEMEKEVLKMYAIRCQIDESKISVAQAQAAIEEKLKQLASE